MPVGNSDQLSHAVDAARAGDCIVLGEGEYTFPRISLKATAEHPIVIRAAHRLKSLVTGGKLEMARSAYVTVEGLLWQSSGDIRLVDCDHCRVTRCRLQLADGKFDWVTVGGKSVWCRIDHNDFGPKIAVGNMLMLAGSGSQTVQHTRIDHNFFHDVHRTHGNGWEVIRAGLSHWSFSSAFTIVEDNLFQGCDGDPEIISIKSSDNVIRHNTMRGNAGQLTLRHGNRSFVYGNYILGNGVAKAGGIRVHGQDHHIFNNYVEGVSAAGINLEGGESDDNGGALTDHKQVHRARVLFNTIIGKRGIAVGGVHPMQPVDSVIANNLLAGRGALVSLADGAQNTRCVGNIASDAAASPRDGVRALDPKLVKDGEIFELSAGSPAIDAADPSFPFVVDDIRGRPRDKQDVGASEHSTAPAIFGPLGLGDVGPDAP